MSSFSLALLFVTVSHMYHLPQGLLSGVCYVESRHNPKAMHYDDGGATSIGICQIQLGTARLLGFKGSQEQLRDPKINVRIAAQYLAYELHRYRGDIRKAVSAYNSGTWTTNKRGLTKNRKYVSKVLAAWGADK